VGYLKAVLTFFLLPLLPERFRERWPWDPPLGIGPLSHISVWLHAVAALSAWAVVFVLYQEAYAEKVSEALASTDSEPGAITFLGAVTFFSFFFSLRGILMNLVLVDAAARLIHVVGSGEPMGSAFLAVPLYLAGKLLDYGREARLTAAYGLASEPDRILLQGDGLVVRANRPHDTWHAILTYAYGEKHYRLEGHREAQEGKKRCYEYLLGPWPDRETVRKIVRLDGGEPAGIESRVENTSAGPPLEGKTDGH
jgi:hypothetical protein